MASASLPYPCAIVVIKSSGIRGKSYDFPEQRAWCALGSHPDCDVRVQSSDVAPLHALVRVDDDAVSIQALDPSYPICLPSSKLSSEDKPLTLAHGEQFSLGSRDFVVEFTRPSTHSAATPKSTPSSSRRPARRRSSLLVAEHSETFVENPTEPADLLRRLSNPDATAPTPTAIANSLSTRDAQVPAPMSRRKAARASAMRGRRAVMARASAAAKSDMYSRLCSGLPATPRRSSTEVATPRSAARSAVRPPVRVFAQTAALPVIEKENSVPMAARSEVALKAGKQIFKRNPRDKRSPLSPRNHQTVEDRTSTHTPVHRARTPVHGVRTTTPRRRVVFPSHDIELSAGAHYSPFPRQAVSRIDVVDDERVIGAQSPNMEATPSRSILNRPKDDSSSGEERSTPEESSEAESPDIAQTDVQAHAGVRSAQKTAEPVRRDLMFDDDADTAVQASTDHEANLLDNSADRSPSEDSLDGNMVMPNDAADSANFDQRELEEADVQNPTHTAEQKPVVSTAPEPRESFDDAPVDSMEEESTHPVENEIANSTGQEMSDPVEAMSIKSAVQDSTEPTGPEVADSVESEQTVADSEEDVPAVDGDHISAPESKDNSVHPSEENDESSGDAAEKQCAIDTASTEMQSDSTGETDSEDTVSKPDAPSRTARLSGALSSLFRRVSGRKSSEGLPDDNPVVPTPVHTNGADETVEPAPSVPTSNELEGMTEDMTPDMKKSIMTKVVDAASSIRHALQTSAGGLANPQEEDAADLSHIAYTYEDGERSDSEQDLSESNESECHGGDEIDEIFDGAKEDTTRRIGADSGTEEQDSADMQSGEIALHDTFEASESQYPSVGNKNDLAATQAAMEPGSFPQENNVVVMTEGEGKNTLSTSPHTSLEDCEEREEVTCRSTTTMDDTDAKKVLAPSGLATDEEDSDSHAETPAKDSDSAQLETGSMEPEIGSPRNGEGSLKLDVESPKASAQSETRHISEERVSDVVVEEMGSIDDPSIETSPIRPVLEEPDEVVKDPSTDSDINATPTFEESEEEEEEIEAREMIVAEEKCSADAAIEETANHDAGDDLDEDMNATEMDTDLTPVKTLAESTKVPDASSEVQAPSTTPPEAGDVDNITEASTKNIEEDLNVDDGEETDAEDESASPVRPNSPDADMLKDVADEVAPSSEEIGEDTGILESTENVEENVLQIAPDTTLENESPNTPAKENPLVDDLVGQLQKLTVKDIRGQLKQHNLSTKGVKKELVLRLAAHVADGGEIPVEDKNVVMPEQEFVPVTPKRRASIMATERISRASARKTATKDRRRVVHDSESEPDVAESPDAEDELSETGDLVLYQRRTVKELRQFLVSRGLDPQIKLRKADLIDHVISLSIASDGSDLQPSENDKEMTEEEDANVIPKTARELREYLKARGMCYSGAREVLLQRANGTEMRKSRRTRASSAADGATTMCTSCRDGEECEGA